MTLGFLSSSRNFCKLLWVSCEVLFLHGYALDPLSGQILHHDCISMIVSRFAIVALRTLSSAVIKSPKFTARGTASPLRLLHGAPCNFGPFTDLAISVFREMSMNIMFTQILTSLCSRL